MNKILQGDCLVMLKKLPDESVDMVMTSPPYYTLRDYGVDGQLGLEPTFEEYINKLCNIFDEVKRVLKKEGTCWVNIGDTYANTSTGGQGATGGRDKSTLSSKMVPVGTTPTKRKKQVVPEKSLCMIPARFSIEMVNRGWILRNEIIWHKPNCMPESVTDRFTTDFEKLFFFVKSKKYWFEQQLEEFKDSSEMDYRRVLRRKNADQYDMKQPYKNNFPKSFNNDGRNMRTVWRIPTKPYNEAHFAVYPEKLCQTPILAGCPEGGIVLDPFMGSGTTCKVAKDLGRQYIGIELNPKYIKIAEKRLAQQYLFN